MVYHRGLKDRWSIIEVIKTSSICVLKEGSLIGILKERQSFVCVLKGGWSLTVVLKDGWSPVRDLKGDLFLAF